MAGNFTHRLGLNTSVSAFLGVLLTPQTNQTGTIAFAAGSEVYDRDGWHDDSTNNSRITVPSGVSLIRVWANTFDGSNGNDIYGKVRKNGSGAYGIGGNNQATNAGTATVAQNYHGAPIEVTAGDYFELVEDSAFNVVTGGTTWLTAEVLDASVKGALVYKTSNQSLTQLVNNIVSFNAEVYDENSYHDNATNNSRFTIPETGVYRVSGSLKLNTSVGHFIAAVYVNGVNNTVPGVVGPSGGYPAVPERFSFSTAPMELTAGDYVEVTAYFDTGSSIQIVADADTWFAIEKQPASIKRCLLKQSGAQTITSSGVNLQWGTEVYDDDNMFDSGTSTTEVIIPAGVTQARVSASLHTVATTTNITMSAQINGAYFEGTGGTVSDTLVNSYGTRQCFMSAWVPVNEGDAVRIRAFSGSNVNTNPSDYNWICVEAR